MAEQHKKILSALGLSQAQIDILENMTPEQLKELKIEDFTGPVKTSFQNQFLNDEGFLENIPEEKTSKKVKKSLESGQYARFMNEMKDAAKELNIDFSDLSAEDQKSLKGFFRETFKKGLTKAGNADALIELQGKLQQALSEKTTLETNTEKRVSDAVAAESKKYGAKLEKAGILSILSNIKGLVVKPEFVADQVLNMVKDKFTPKFNPDTMNFDLKKKDHPDLDVLKTDGSKQTFQETVMDILKTNELWKEPAKEKEQPKVDQVSVNGDHTKVNPIPDYIQKTMNAGLQEEAVTAK